MRLLVKGAEAALPTTVGTGSSLSNADFKAVRTFKPVSANISGYKPELTTYDGTDVHFIVSSSDVNAASASLNCCSATLSSFL